MSDKMTQIPFDKLMERALGDYERDGSIFGVRKLYCATGVEPLEIFGSRLELPFGPAAGPHTQLAQNIIAAYAAGARFFELKTVQTLDGEDLPVSKPCILAADEGYNVEWSTELYVPQALDEYIKGWYALKLLSREYGLGDPDGFVFNMSVGYDLEGIKTEKIDSFIEGLKNAGHTEPWRTCTSWALENLPRFKNVDEAYIEAIDPGICGSITLSTLHGCPPEEIERIASYLLNDKKLHTFVKCNPTLLGYDYARKTLDSLGYDYISFDDHHFKADLQPGDAIPMLQRLQSLADSLSLSFGVKLTNTFPVDITAAELPGEEMYMSGRSLFPLSIELAKRLTQAFEGKLRISYSGGAEFRNIKEIYEAGIWPISMATTLLKPGGYQRMKQIAELLAESTSGSKSFTGVSESKLGALVEKANNDPLYRKPVGRVPERKMKAEVPLLDCFTPPCSDGCPIGQDVPAYLRLAGEGKHLEALRVITASNPLPFITGTICSHRCMDKCTRAFYEKSVDIRAVKLEAAETAFTQLLEETRIPTERAGDKVAVIGGGPAGLSAAYFLAKAGRRATLFEKRSDLGGIVRHVIPEFRIGSGAIDNDVAFIRAMGVELRLNSEVMSLETLRSEGFSQIIIAVGAWKPGALDLDGGEALDVLDFLERLKSDPGSVILGENVVVVGGGNTAMDAARAAKRAKGVKKVSLVYRRTKRYMPADAEELEFALEDGIEFFELLAPVGLRGSALLCDKMELGAPDSSGRRSPVPTGMKMEIPADTVISAVGNSIDGGLLESFGIPTDSRGRAVLDADTLQSGVQGIYLAGDSASGPATVAEAIAGAIKCVEAITGQSIERHSGLNLNPDIKPAEAKKGILYRDCSSVCEPERCLECATICESCVDVCPNRANVSICVDGARQILHIDAACNECGNCEVFCPYSSAPYLDKFTLFASEEDFSGSKNDGFLPLDGDSVRIRLGGVAKDHRDGSEVFPGIWRLIEAARLQITQSRKERK
ncbi:MAG: putative selenate reductase subunit YgfK [Oscillospiraceae bacterium]|nr:putative selenate reductase subunit YgfK [Oscillospiraceae bacterium]